MRELLEHASHALGEQAQLKEALRVTLHKASSLEQELAVAAVERRGNEELVKATEGRLREDLRRLASREEAADAKCGELRCQADVGHQERQKLQEELAVSAADHHRLEAASSGLQQRLEATLAACAATQANAAHIEATCLELRVGKAAADAALETARDQLLVAREEQLIGHGRMSQMEDAHDATREALQEQLRAAWAEAAALQQKLAVTEAERKIREQAAAVGQEKLRRELDVTQRQFSESEEVSNELRRRAEVGLRERQKMQEELAIVAAERRGPTPAWSGPAAEWGGHATRMGELVGVNPRLMHTRTAFRNGGEPAWFRED